METARKPCRPGDPLPFQELIQGLEVEDFDARVERLIVELDASATPIDCFFLRSGNPSASRPARSLLGQYRSEVQRIPLMNRSEEVRFCMGVEFLWRRLRKVREEAGFCPELLDHHPGLGGGEFEKCSQGRVPGPGGFGCVSSDLDPGIRTRLGLRTEEFLAARNELIERNLHIVFRLLERYRGVGVPMEDMIQEANQNLFKAVEGFDFTRGVRFKTYAGFWVNQAFLNAIYNQSRTVRVPAYIQKAMKKIHDAAGSVEAGLADQEGISRESGIPIELVGTAINGNRFTLSLDKVFDREEGSRVLDLLPDSEAGPDYSSREEGALLGFRIKEALEDLNPREQTILQLRFGFKGGRPHTLAEVGARLNISLERVRQIQKAALAKIRKGRRRSLLEQYA